MNSSSNNQNNQNDGSTVISQPSSADDAIHSSIHIYGIARNSIVDGPGVRYTVFTQGCRHACSKCHNQASWRFDGGIRMDIDTIVDEIRSDALCTGLSISGGDPFYRMSETLELVETIRREFGNEFSIWIWSGFTYDELICNNVAKKILNHCDVLVDGLYVNALRDADLMWRGSSNQCVIDLRATQTTGKLTLHPSNSSYIESSRRRIGYHPPK